MRTDTSFVVVSHEPAMLPGMRHFSKATKGVLAALAVIARLLRHECRGRRWALRRDRGQPQYSERFRGHGSRVSRLKHSTPTRPPRTGLP